MPFDAVLIMFMPVKDRPEILLRLDQLLKRGRFNGMARPFHLRYVDEEKDVVPLPVFAELGGEPIHVRREILAGMIRSRGEDEGSITLDHIEIDGTVPCLPPLFRRGHIVVALRDIVFKGKAVQGLSCLREEGDIIMHDVAVDDAEIEGILCVHLIHVADARIQHFLVGRFRLTEMCIGCDREAQQSFTAGQRGAF